MGNVFQREHAEPLEHEAQPAVRMVTDRARNTDPAWRALGLKPGRHVHSVTMQVGAVGDHIADIDSNTKPNASVRGQTIIIFGQSLLDRECAAHCPVNAIEHYEQRVAAGLHDVPAVLSDDWIDQSATQGP